MDARTIQVEWETVSPKTTRQFRVTAKKTLDLFSEIEGAVRKFKGHLIAGKIDDDGAGKLVANFTMELESADDFKKVLKNIRTVPSVLTIHDVPEASHHDNPYRDS
jgi:GTP pyrophosphokinase